MLTQAVTSLASGVLFLGPVSQKNDTNKILHDVVINPVIPKISVLLGIVTALVIIWLGLLLYRLLCSTHTTMATTALAMYVAEAVLLTISHIFAYGIIQLAGSAQADANLLTSALISLKDFSAGVAMIAFGLGAVLFYYLLYKSRVIPTWLSLWGLVTVVVVLIVSTLRTFGVHLPFQLMLPYAPWEFVTGIYIIVRGLYIRRVSKQDDSITTKP